MSELVEEHVDTTSVIARMTEFHSGLRLGHMLSTVAELGVADHLVDGPLPVDELAARTGTHADSLYRVLRALASKGVFTEVSRREFGLTPLADTLRSDAERSMRDVFRLQGKPFMRDAYGAIEHTVRTGEPAFEHVNGASLFEYLAARPEMTALFSRAMGNGARQVQRAAVAAYDFSGIRLLVDVGGAHGHLIAMVLDRYPDLRAVLFDQPHVVSGAGEFLDGTGHRSRIEVVGGDYFESVPAGGDAYVLSHVFHQLSDEEGLVVLRNIREAMVPGGKLLIVDPILPEGDVPHPGKFMDITMMALTRGRDRTEQELRDLLAGAGLRLVETVALSAPSSIAVVTTGASA
ncbi:acetylserotonin O-methyltransferase [Saccharothrix sp. S26]|uniref:acetylserotonin O-methyltransferase n=1 Tax=Saccharothrix sp. S26 TaxID=2907215 RepID=UPI001F480B2C|nr:acetylserotonin O-methyltransferase [Saccharothrix sp. S26]MCE6995358.1 acetylserotonin O-methyltransferase [Saccharothrix sp. S26]